MIVESVSYGSKSLVRTRSSTFRTVVSADENNFTNGDLVALFFLILSFFLCLLFLYFPEPRRRGRYLWYVVPHMKPIVYFTVLNKKCITENPIVKVSMHQIRRSKNDDSIQNCEMKIEVSFLRYNWIYVFVWPIFCWYIFVISRHFWNNHTNLLVVNVHVG